jgi:hypothetical protein
MHWIAGGWSADDYDSIVPPGQLELIVEYEKGGSVSKGSASQGLDREVECVLRKVLPPHRGM